jgi:hypothetical protein
VAARKCECNFVGAVKLFTNIVIAMLLPPSWLINNRATAANVTGNDVGIPDVDPTSRGTTT